MRNFFLLLWVMFGSFIFIECRDPEWRIQPWFGKDFSEEWLKVPEFKEHSEDQSSGEDESGDKSSSENMVDIDSEQYAEDPVTWPCLYKGCRGKKQSPINIDTQAITTDGNLGPLKFENYDTPLKDLTIKNVGFTVAVFVPISANVIATSDWLGNRYRLLAIAVAYGHTNKNGSEHTIDSKYYPLEVTLVHLNEKYDKLENQPDSLLHIVILFEIGKENAAINTITKSLRDIKKVDSNTTLKSLIKIKDLLPKFPENYVTYNGSVLHPPCSEIVRYVVFRSINTIGQKQLEKFRTLETVKYGRDLNEKTRPIQPLYDRKILGTKNREEKDWWFQQPSQEYWK